MESLEDTRDGIQVEMMRTHLWRLIMFHLNFDGTEDDDDDDDETTHNELVILVAKDVKTGTYAATCLRGKERVSMPRGGWCRCCVDLGIAIVAL